MQKEQHKLSVVFLLLWIVGTILLVFFGFQFLRMAMSHSTGTIRLLQFSAMALVGLILLALGTIPDRLLQIVLYLRSQ
jgi:hypothetical protein